MSATGKGVDLLAVLGLDVVKSSRDNVFTHCVWCPSSDALSVHAETGIAHCFACGKQGGALELAEAVRNGDRKTAIDDLVSVGIFERRDSESRNPRGRNSQPAIDPIEEMARAKGCSAEMLRAFGATAGVYGYQRTKCAIFPMYGADGKPCSTFSVAARTTAKPAQLQKGMCEEGRPAGVFLPRGEKPEPGETWIGVEGVKDAAKALELGDGKWKAIGFPRAALPAEFVAWFRGVNVVLIPDRDRPGLKGAHQAGKMLYGIAASVRVVTLPVEWRETKGKDLRDACHELGDDAVRELIESSEPWEPSDDADDGRARILVAVEGTDVDPLRVTEQTVQALLAKNDPPTIFARGGEIVTIREGAIRPIEEKGLDALIVRAATHVVDRGKSRDENPVPCPKHVARTILGGIGLDQWPKISGIVSSPTLRADGSLIATPGYDALTGLVLAPGAISVVVPERPTREDAKAALERLLEPFKEFPLETGGSKATLVALLLTPAMRRIYDGATPLFLVDAEAPKAGKSKLVEIVARIHTGAPARMVPMGRDEELEKQIASALVSGRPILNIDNVKGRLDSGALERMLTASTWEGRLLGTNDKQLVLDNAATWCVTANNVQMGSEVERRTVLIRLLEQERAKFAVADLEGWVGERRVELYSAVLTIVRAWIHAGKPAQDRAPVLPSFERWSRSVGACAVWLGHTILQNQHLLRARNDAEVGEWEVFLLQLLEGLPGLAIAGATAADIALFVRGEGITMGQIVPGELARDLDRPNFSQLLGAALKKRAGRAHGQSKAKIVSVGMDRRKVQKWRVEAEALEQEKTFEEELENALKWEAET